MQRDLLNSYIVNSIFLLIVCGIAVYISKKYNLLDLYEKISGKNVGEEISNPWNISSLSNDSERKNTNVIQDFWNHLSQKDFLIETIKIFLCVFLFFSAYTYYTYL
jgi:hypothetical protein